MCEAGVGDKESGSRQERVASRGRVALPLRPLRPLLNMFFESGKDVWEALPIIFLKLFFF